jgi:type IV pilus assembly protein PilA
MAILIGVLAPQYIKYVEKSRISSDEDCADSLKNAAMTATTDEEYIYSIKDGATIKFSKGGVACADTGLQAALNEYFAKWTECKVKSKSYQAKTYTVTISEDKKTNALKVSATW